MAGQRRCATTTVAHGTLQTVNEIPWDVVGPVIAIVVAVDLVVDTRRRPASREQ